MFEWILEILARKGSSDSKNNQDKDFKRAVKWEKVLEVYCKWENL